VPELGAGVWSHHVATPTPSEQEFVNLSVLMYGIKAFNFYMLVERDRWQGSPITRHGERRAEYASFYAQFTEFLNKWQFWRFCRTPSVLVLLSYDLGRFEAANSTLNFAHTDLYGLPWALFDDTRDLGLRFDRAAPSWLATLKHLLRSACIDYDIADTHIDLARLAEYDTVFVQSCDFLARADQERLLAYIPNLILGPGVPYLDEYLRPYSVLDGVRIATEPDLPHILESLRGDEFRVDDARLDIVLHTDGARQLLFISNPTTDRIRAQVNFDGARRFTSAWGQARTVEGTDQVEVSLREYEVQIWAV
jgi:beta-galactosidase